MIQFKKITAIILDGCKSSLMGQDKGLLDIKGKPMVKYIIDNLKSSGIDDIIIVANNDEYKKFNQKVYRDIIKEQGPLGGIYTGLSHSYSEWNLIVSCDVPNLTPKYFNLLIEQGTNKPLSILQNEGRNHYLIGFFHQSLTPVVKEHLELRILKMEDFFENVGGWAIPVCDYLETNTTDFTNVNTRTELEVIEYETRN